MVLLLYYIIIYTRNKQDMQDKKSMQKLFQTQCITIRKAIRQIDLGFENDGVIGQPKRKSDVNILVVGPSGSGKTTLLRTMHYALNGSLSCVIEKRSLGDVNFDRFQIKKNRRAAIQGLAKLKQTDEKLGVYGYQINFNSLGLQYASPMDKYARAVQLMNNRTLGCISYGMSSTGLGAINYVIVCLSMVAKISKQELLALRFFISEMDEKKIKFNIVGTHQDQIFDRQSIMNNSFSSNYSNVQMEKLLYIEKWKKFVISEISPKLYVEIYCMENYPNIQNKQEFQNSETVNYYSLILLDNCIKKAPESQKAKKVSLKLFCF